MSRKIVLLIGAPGAGKGTVGGFLEESLDFTIISTGNVARKEIDAKTPLGLELAEKNAKGEFFSDELAFEIGKTGLIESKGNIVLDGFPRNLNQAYMFDEYLKENDEKLSLVLHLECDLNTIIHRLKDRRVCPKCGTSYHLVNLKPKVNGICDKCGSELIKRRDDEPEIITSRYQTYLNQTEPIIEHYMKKGIVRTVRSDLDTEIMFENVKKIVK
jgi:adenylate kinase